ncbi:MAG: metallophosphoesterase family protein, partial [Desulfurococcaceae archaeon]
MLKKIFDSIYAVSDTRTLYIDGINVLVLADAHLGFEEDMARSGFFIPRAQLLKAINYVEKALGYIGEVSRVVIDGDLKHAFDRLLRQEKLEVKQFLDYLTKERRVKEVVVVRGNHDNFLPIVLKEYGVNLVDSIEYSVAGLKILLTHGHKELDLSHDAVIIGHEHPSINLVDSLGLL